MRSDCGWGVNSWKETGTVSSGTSGYARLLSFYPGCYDSTQGVMFLLRVLCFTQGVMVLLRVLCFYTQGVMSKLTGSVTNKFS